MTRDEFDAATAASRGVRSANFHMTSGQIWRKATWSFVPASDSLITLDVEGPPVFIPIAEIEAIHLCA